MRTKSIILISAVASLYFNNTYAQETVQDSVKTSSIDQVVITGNSRPKKKIESSTAISTFTAKDIEKQNPISAAALLQRVPGFAVETSGGETGNNLFARGIPSAGAYEFVQVQEDGLPVFEDGALQFANADNFFRVDNTTGRLEALRGGSGSIYANNSPGGLINFISKEGTNKFKGTAKLETSSYGLMRTDINLGGAIVQDKLFFNIGGFYRSDNGIRKTGYKANQGGQFRANLKYVFDKGYAKVSYKKLDDRTTFYLPILSNTKWK
ncbi:TonB-dependent receptor plug domain-containing protein [Halpernia sp. GG3]